VERDVDRGFAGFLRQSLALLAAESPVHLAAMASAFRARQVRIMIDDEAAVQLTSDGRALRFSPEAVDAAVEVSFSSRDLLRVLGGDETLDDAIIEGRVAVRGRCPDVLAFDEALRAWLHGAVRSPSFPSLLHRLEAHYAASRGDQHSMGDVHG